jgi:hypothetical protein
VKTHLVISCGKFGSTTSGRVHRSLIDPERRVGCEQKRQFVAILRFFVAQTCTPPFILLRLLRALWPSVALLGACATVFSGDKGRRIARA